MIESGRRPLRKYLLFGVLICCVALLILWLRIRLNGGELLDYKVSPDGKYIAEYRLYKQSGATTTDDKAVQVRTKLNPFRHTLVDALDYGADLSITWIDSRNLLITCPESGGKLDFYGKDTNWREISIHYELDGCQIGSPKGERPAR
jgi:hypothetical protein